MTPDQHTAPEEKLIVVRCRGCKQYFSAPTRHRKRCDTCRATRRHSVASGLIPQTRERALKDVSLSCGHLTRLPHRPIEGEELWCSRCCRWVEYGNKTRPLCRNDLHSMTPFNTSHHGNEKICRKCWYEETGEFL